MQQEDFDKKGPESVKLIHEDKSESQSSSFDDKVNGSHPDKYADKEKKDLKIEIEIKPRKHFLYDVDETPPLYLLLPLAFQVCI